MNVEEEFGSLWSMLCKAQIESNAIKILSLWWKTKLASFTGYHDNCRDICEYLDTFRCFMLVKKDTWPSLVTFYTQLLKDNRMEIARIYSMLDMLHHHPINGRIHNIHFLADKANVIYAQRFLMDFYRDTDIHRHLHYAALVCGAGENANLLYQECTYHVAIDPRADVKAKHAIASAWFSGYGVPVQSYSHAIKYGMDPSLCVAIGDTRGQFPIILRIMIDKTTDLFFRTISFVLMLRTVCHTWNNVILKCGTFWQGFNLKKPTEAIMLQELSTFVIAKKEKRYAKRRKTCFNYC